MKLIGIYCIQHKETSKIYIGQSTDINDRIRRHFRRKEQMYIYNAINKYGKDTFVSYILELCTVSELDDRERHWITTLNSLAPNGYNLNIGGHSNKTLTPEHRAKIGAKHKGKTISVEHRQIVSNARKQITGEKHHNYGKSMSQEQKDKIRNTLTGKYTGEDNPFYGKKHSEETRAKMRAAHAKRKQK